MKYTPHPWNQVLIDHMLDAPRGGGWAGMGTGKTGSTLTALQLLQDVVDPRPYLVLAPKRVAGYTWPREAEKWDHIHGDTVPLLGTAGDRLSALRRGLKSSSAARFTINYENIPWLVETMSDLGIKWPWPTIVADEATRLKSFRKMQGGKRAQALSKVSWEGVDRFIELTGTPAPNGLADLWGQVWFLDKGKRLGTSYTAYMKRWFQQDYSGFGWTPMSHAADEIMDRLRDICLSVSVPVEQPLVNKVMVELPPAARTFYTQMARDFFVEYQGTEIEAAHAAAKSNKLLQIASGAIYDDDKVARHLHDAKIEALDSVIAEAGGAPVLVATNFKFEGPMIQRAFKGARVLDSNQDLDDWNAGKIPVGIAHPASLGHGLDLQHGGNIMVFYSGDWNLEHHDQIIERIGPMRQMQSGYNRPVYLHYLLAENTMDEAVFERRQSKCSVQEALMAGMKAHGY